MTNNNIPSRPSIDRRAFLKTMGGLSASALLAPAGLSAADSAPPRKKPNFLVVVADDQCFRTLNALNNREVHTPAFDRLLARGTVIIDRQGIVRYVEYAPMVDMEPDLSAAIKKIIELAG